MRGLGSWYVVKRRTSVWENIGLLLIVIGLAGMIWTNYVDFDPGNIARVALVIGTIHFCYCKLVRRTAANDESYKLGYDIGYEAGHTEGHRKARPVVVDMPRRCSCGGLAVAAHAARVE